MLGSVGEQGAGAGVALLAAVNRFKFLKTVTPGQDLRGLVVMDVRAGRIIAERHQLHALQPITRKVSGQRRSLQMHIPTMPSKARQTLKPSLPTSK